MLDGLKLFVVDVEAEINVLARDEKHAIEIAKDNDDSFDVDYDYSARERQFNFKYNLDQWTREIEPYYDRDIDNRYNGMEIGEIYDILKSLEEQRLQKIENDKKQLKLNL